MITIGSDPEFGLLKEGGSQAMAYDYLPNNHTEAIGLDGHSDIGELRPQHAVTPRGHVHNIAHLMAKLDDFVPAEIRVTAGSMVGPDAIGGHIHFGDLGRNFDKRLAVKALDYFLALPVSMLEVPRSAMVRRTQKGYGGLGSYRDQDWGFEYRTLPSWLTSWGVALSVLSIGYAVVDAVKNKSCPKIPQNVPDPRDFNYCKKGAMEPFLDDIKRGWRKLPLYPKFRLEAAFLNHLLVRELEWREKEGIRDKWHRRRKPAKGFHIVGNSRDENCIQIAGLVESDRDLRVLIYGLSPSRDHSMALSHTVSPWPEPATIERFGTAASAQYDDWLCIGLSLSLRQEVEEATRMVEAVLNGDIAMDGPRQPTGRTSGRAPRRTTTTEGERWRSQTRDRLGRWVTEEGIPF